MTNVVYVVLGSAGSLLGCVLAARQILSAMRRKWEADTEQTRAVRDNTRAVQDLTGQMAGMVSQLADHERRLTAGGL